LEGLNLVAPPCKHCPLWHRRIEGCSENSNDTWSGNDDTWSGNGEPFHTFRNLLSMVEFRCPPFVNVFILRVCPA
jgi:hypothetical protein